MNTDTEFENTDIELWRESPDAYAASIHATAQGGIGINVGGYVIVKPLRVWHSLASAKSEPAEGFLRNCEITVRPGEGPLFLNVRGVFLDGYRIEPLEHRSTTAEQPAPAARIVQMVLDDLEICAGEYPHPDWQSSELSTETIEALDAYRSMGAPGGESRVEPEVGTIEGGFDSRPNLHVSAKEEPTTAPAESGAVRLPQGAYWRSPEQALIDALEQEVAQLRAALAERSKVRQPPKLTDEQIGDLWEKACGNNAVIATYLLFARLLEAALAEQARPIAELEIAKKALTKIAAEHVVFPEKYMDGYASMAVVTAREAMAALAASPQPQEQDHQAERCGKAPANSTDYCWLVEMFNRGGNSLGRYHTGFTDLHNVSRSTANPHEAKRYYARENAENVAADLNRHMLACEWRAVEHGFDTQQRSHAERPDDPADGKAPAGEQP